MQTHKTSLGKTKNAELLKPIYWRKGELTLQLLMWSSLKHTGKCALNQCLYKSVIKK